MANQQHVLALKAVLDTSDIQAKLAQMQSTASGLPGPAAAGASLSRLDNSLEKLDKSAKKATDSLDRMGKAGALLAAGHFMSSQLRKSGMAADEDIAALDFTMKGMALGGMLKGKKGALIGGGMSLLETMLMNMMRDDSTFASAKDTLKNIPVFGEQIASSLEQLREVFLTLSGDKAAQQAEEQARIDARLEHVQSAKDLYSTSKKAWQTQQSLLEIGKESDAGKLQQFVIKALEAKQALADLFDPDSETFKNLQQANKDAGDFSIALADAVQNAKKDLAESSVLARAAQSKIDELDADFMKPSFFGPMTNFSKMGMSFGESNVKEDKFLHNQEQIKTYVERISDKISRGESNLFATWQ